MKRNRQSCLRLFDQLAFVFADGVFLRISRFLRRLMNNRRLWFWHCCWFHRRHFNLRRNCFRFRLRCRCGKHWRRRIAVFQAETIPHFRNYDRSYQCCCCNNNADERQYLIPVPLIAVITHLPIKTSRRSAPTLTQGYSGVAPCFCYRFHLKKLLREAIKTPCSL